VKQSADPDQQRLVGVYMAEARFTGLAGREAMCCDGRSALGRDWY
jgi:hypothetical protein